MKLKMTTPQPHLASSSTPHLSIGPVQKVKVPHIPHSYGEQLERHTGQTTPLDLRHRVPRQGVKLGPRVDPVTGAGRLTPRAARPLPRLRLRDLLDTESFQTGARLVVPEEGGWGELTLS